MKFNAIKINELDMVSSLEIDEAIKVHSKVASRVFEIAKIIGLMTGELDGEEPNLTMTSFHISPSKNYSEEDKFREKNEVSVRLSYHKDVKDEFGDVDEDHVYSRMVSFPRRYLTSNNWAHEVLEQVKIVRRNRAKMNIEYTRNKIKEEKEELKRLQNRLKKEIEEANLL